VPLSHPVGARDSSRRFGAGFLYYKAAFYFTQRMLLQGIMHSKLHGDLSQRTLFFRDTLPSLVRFCKAFPLVIENCTDLLVKVFYTFRPATVRPAGLNGCFAASPSRKYGCGSGVGRAFDGRACTAGLSAG
jgi:hypothetical protein